MNILAPDRNVIIRIDLNNKKSYKFSNGLEIVLERGYNFNLREDAASIGVIINGDGLPKGAMCLIHHNSSHATYKVDGVIDDEGNEIPNLYSVPTDMIFCYREENKSWQPMKDFLITLRLFREYKGTMIGIEPEQIQQRLYIVGGKVGNNVVEGRVALVTKHSDYEIMFHENGKPASVIRTRERELLGVDLELTRQVKEGKILIGNNLKTAKYLS